MRGTSREDIRPGLRTISYRKRVVVAFDVDADRVNIIGIFYGGQDYETVLQAADEEAEVLPLATIPFSPWDIESCRLISPTP
jgi:toxin ParE1/3/4